MQCNIALNLTNYYRKKRHRAEYRVAVFFTSPCGRGHINDLQTCRPGAVSTMRHTRHVAFFRHRTFQFLPRKDVISSLRQCCRCVAAIGQLTANARSMRPQSSVYRSKRRFTNETSPLPQPPKALRPADTCLVRQAFAASWHTHCLIGPHRNSPRPGPLNGRRQRTSEKACNTKNAGCSPGKRRGHRRAMRAMRTTSGASRAGCRSVRND
jgi:hypothetical protein